MGLSCGSRTIKMILVIFNVIFWLAGVVLLAVGIWYIVDDDASHYLNILDSGSDKDLVQAAAITVTAVGGFIFLVAFFGCCGAWLESPCLLTVYAFILVILLIIQVTAGILAIVFKDELLDRMEDSMNKTLQMDYKYNDADHDTNSINDAWDFMQVQFKCCGTYDYQDWRTSNWKSDSVDNTQNVPDTCCKLTNSDYQNPEPVDGYQCQLDASLINLTSSDALYVNGCSASLEKWIKDHSGLLVGLTFGFIIIEILGISLACSLKGSVKNLYEYV